VARALDKWLRKDIYQRFDWVMRESGDVKGKTVCDVGCGSGRFVTALAKRGAAHVTGVDIAPEMLKIARELTANDGVADKCSFFNSDVLDWKTSDTFDLTIAIGFWDYIQEPHSRLAKIRSITKGRFLSAWPRSGTMRAPIRKVRLTALGCPVYFFSRDEVYKYLGAAGFRVDSCETIGQLHCASATAI
ncbi:MAG TPA: class I SAM-dependent methyltransferase, partial [Gemmatimonadaceae bacterium]|nr:class I SAM-dependent methyltransferase [Gemmatimonadaceae bacterium]